MIYLIRNKKNIYYLIFFYQKKRDFQIMQAVLTDQPFSNKHAPIRYFEQTIQQEYETTTALMAFFEDDISIMSSLKKKENVFVKQITQIENYGRSKIQRQKYNGYCQNIRQFFQTNDFNFQKEKLQENLQRLKQIMLQGNPKQSNNIKQDQIKIVQKGVNYFQMFFFVKKWNNPKLQFYDLCYDKHIKEWKWCQIKSQQKKQLQKLVSIIQEEQEKMIKRQLYKRTNEHLKAQVDRHNKTIKQLQSINNLNSLQSIFRKMILVQPQTIQQEVKTVKQIALPQIIFKKNLNKGGLKRLVEIFQTLSKDTLQEQRKIIEKVINQHNQNIGNKYCQMLTKFDNLVDSLYIQGYQVKLQQKKYIIQKTKQQNVKQIASSFDQFKKYIQNNESLEKEINWYIWFIYRASFNEVRMEEKLCLLENLRQSPAYKATKNKHQLNNQSSIQHIQSPSIENYQQLKNFTYINSALDQINKIKQNFKKVGQISQNQIKLCHISLRKNLKNLIKENKLLNNKDFQSITEEQIDKYFDKQSNIYINFFYMKEKIFEGKYQIQKEQYDKKITAFLNIDFKKLTSEISQALEQQKNKKKDINIIKMMGLSISSQVVLLKKKKKNNNMDENENEQISQNVDQILDQILEQVKNIQPHQFTQQVKQKLINKVQEIKNNSIFQRQLMNQVIQSGKNSKFIKDYQDSSSEQKSCSGSYMSKEICREIQYQEDNQSTQLQYDGPIVLLIVKQKLEDFDRAIINSLCQIMNIYLTNQNIEIQWFFQIERPQKQIGSSSE